MNEQRAGYMSASRLFELADVSSGDRFTVYRCNVCFAMVLGDEARDHLWWHDSAPGGAARSSQSDRLECICDRVAEGLAFHTRQCEKWMGMQ